MRTATADGISGQAGPPFRAVERGVPNLDRVPSGSELFKRLEELLQALIACGEGRRSGKDFDSVLQ
jgi:hypothetical protein